MNSRFERPADRLIVALDVPTAAQALHLAERLAPEVGALKVGLELFNAVGPDILRRMVATGAKVFYDAKLHDIPNTVAGAVRTSPARTTVREPARTRRFRTSLEPAGPGSPHSQRSKSVQGPA